MPLARRIISLMALLISVVVSLVFVAAPASAGLDPTGAGLDTVYHHYSGPYGSEESCNASAQAMHDPESGYYAVWPCTWANYWGPGWYFYYQWHDCERCTRPDVGTLRGE